MAGKEEAGLVVLTFDVVLVEVMLVTVLFMLIVVLFACAKMPGIRAAVATRKASDTGGDTFFLLEKLGTAEDIVLMLIAIILPQTTYLIHCRRKLS